MKLLNPNIQLENFFQQLKKAPFSVLVLDFDGTIAPFSINRMDVKIYPEIIPVLEQLLENPKVNIVVVSGRSLEDLSKLLPFYNEIEVWGSHGLERKTVDGIVKREFADPHLIKTLKAATEICIKKEHMSERCENKPYGFAMHWRGLPLQVQELLRKKVWSEWLPIIEDTILEIHDFNGGIELRPKGKNKSQAIFAILRETPQEACIAYLGDDQTDEDAFRALGTRGLKILVRKDSIPTLADMQLIPPEELLQFLNQWQAA